MHLFACNIWHLMVVDLMIAGDSEADSLAPA
jgi:hypothetical protein